MDSHNGADISCEVTPAGSDGEVFGGVETICVDHEVAVVLVDCRCFASIAAIEEFRQGLSFFFVNQAHVKPSAITW